MILEASQQHLQNIKENMQALLYVGTAYDSQGDYEWPAILEEKKSTQQGFGNLCAIVCPDRAIRIDSRGKKTGFRLAGSTASREDREKGYEGVHSNHGISATQPRRDT
jgi:hypothetical protein